MPSSGYSSSSKWHLQEYFLQRYAYTPGSSHSYQAPVHRDSSSSPKSWKAISLRSFAKAFAANPWTSTALFSWRSQPFGPRRCLTRQLWDYRTYGLTGVCSWTLSWSSNDFWQLFCFLGTVSEWRCRPYDFRTVHSGSCSQEAADISSMRIRCFPSTLAINIRTSADNSSRKNSSSHHFDYAYLSLCWDW